MRRTSAAYIFLLLALLVLRVPALSITITPTFNAMDTNMSITFTNHTNGINSSYTSGYAYTISGPTYPIVLNNTMTFKKPGNYLIAESITNAGNYSISSNSLVVVGEQLTVSIYPRNPQAVMGFQQPLLANVSGGTPPYKYQWYNDSNCSISIENATQASYTTNALNQSESYCVKVNDTYDRQVNTSTNISIEQAIYTRQGEVTSIGNHYAIIAPEIIAYNNSYVILNVTPYALFNITICNETYPMYETQLTPTYANISISNRSFNFPSLTPLPYSNGNCFMKLLNISWSPAIDTSSFELYFQASTSTTSVSTSTTTSTSISTSSTINTTTTTISQNQTLQSTGTPKPRNGWILWVVGIVILAMIGGILYWWRIRENGSLL